MGHSLLFSLFCDVALSVIEALSGGLVEVWLRWRGVVKEHGCLWLLGKKIDCSCCVGEKKKWVAVMVLLLCCECVPPLLCVVRVSVLCGFKATEMVAGGCCDWQAIG